VNLPGEEANEPNESNALAIQGPQIEQMIGQIEQMIAVQVAVHAEY